jgi:hypothetical protein
MSKNQQAAPVASRARTSPEGTESVPPDLMQEVFLPVHGNVELFVEELAIVDHPAFQRLRRVRQLGMAHMVSQVRLTIDSNTLSARCTSRS